MSGLEEVNLKYVFWLRLLLEDYTISAQWMTSVGRIRYIQ
jgi:hypothetical protein